MKLFKIWWLYTKNTTQIAIQSRFGAIFFLLGKFLRFGLILYFLYILLSKTDSLAGYNLHQVIFFYATFNLIDGIPQFLLREVYRFRVYVIKGYFDYMLAQPLSPLFRALLGGSDVLDIPLLLISVFFLIYSGSQLGDITIVGIFFYLALLINGLLIALSFHIFILGVGVQTSEVDNSIMFYRDLIRMGQIPIDVYRAPINFLITFIIPVGIMISFPVKALLGLLSIQFILLSLLIGITCLFLSLWFWRYSLRKYSSVSS
jgi:ABC-2 type transport system permease protein